MLSYYNWGLQGDTIVELTMDQKEVYLTMQQLFKRFEEPTIIYPKAELSNLFMQVLPHLRKIGTVEITKEVGAEIQESPLAVVFHCVKSKVRSICKLISIMAK